MSITQNGKTGWHYVMEGEEKQSRDHEASATELKELIHGFKAGEIQYLEIPTAEPKEVFELTRNCYDDFIQAAGGLVINDEGHVLVIFRHGHWDLPKGKVDPGETLEQAAVREVEEETGINGLRIEKHLVNTYHTYPHKGGVVLKETTWYLMRCPGGDFKPQLEEGITLAEWRESTHLEDVKTNTYENIRLVLAEL